MRKIILASTSARRKAILTQIGIRFTVENSNFIEDMTQKLPPTTLTKRLSLGKASVLAEKYADAIIIAADTVIVFEKKIIGKPHTVEKARLVLKELSGKSHTVITGVTIIDTKIKKKLSFSTKTRVVLKSLTLEEIDAYIKTDEPLDKAGGYAIQGLGAGLVKKINGDYFNVVGLPIYPLIEQLKKFNIFIYK